MALVGRPHCLSNGAYFYNLVGVWPLVKLTRFQRSPKILARQAPKIVPVAFIGEVWRVILSNKILSSVRSVVRRAKTLLTLQNDGARVDSKRTMRERIGLELKAYGFDINLERRPENLPNLEVLHVEFSR